MIKQARGFTLVELMIVVAIVGILAAVAYPAYQEQIRKTRRADAQATLGQVAQWMERYYSNNFRYSTTAGGTTPPTLPTTLQASPIESSTKYYNITLVITNAGLGFQATATPIIGSSQAVDGFLRIDNTDAKAWDRDNNGTITTGGTDGENCWGTSCSS
ncbi:MAG: hypothetical protein A2286_12550 [Gammaproteobacteria bacterium RIFOXYA12_FULL_61_12]|nr:MAG: hypothetical protein A2514_15570 [Gammaproteobacteria bacterium RIFOXYD12_FULL_61_37]OGT94316.1 MAG: hypothetical protein A2286_12550 [Gammaproteobacteria bacterium RIFOXYA12_FULL_61_12]